MNTGQRVSHSKYGEGTVMTQYSDGNVLVKFDEYGERVVPVKGLQLMLFS